MELPKRTEASETVIDALTYMTQEKWDALGSMAAALNTPMSQTERTELEMEIFNAAGELLGDEAFERISVIGLGQQIVRESSHSATESQLAKPCLMGVTGQYDGITTIEYNPEDTNRKTSRESKEALAITLTAERGRLYCFVLQRSALAHIGVHERETDTPNYISQLQRQCRRIERYCSSADFRELPTDVQELQLTNMLEELNDNFELFVPGAMKRVKCRQPLRHTKTLDAYTIQAVEGEVAYVSGDAAAFVRAEGVHKIMFEIVDSQTDIMHRISPKHILDILSFEHATTEHTVNLLRQWFGDTFQEESRRMSVNLQYADEDSEECYVDMRDELNSLLPSNAMLSTTYITGGAFIETDTDELAPVFVESDNMRFIEPDFKKIDGTFEAVLKMEDCSNNVEATKPLYIVPSPRYLLRFESPVSTEHQVLESIEQLHQEADYAKKCVEDASFYQLPLEHQQEALQVYSENCMEHVEKLGQLCEDFTMECRVQAYRCKPAVIDQAVSWDSSMIETTEANMGDVLIIRADGIVPYNPEVESEERKQAFASRDEFVLSGGEPMLLVEDGAQRLLYLVRARDFIYCSPVLYSDDE